MSLSARAIVGQLAQPDRLRIVAALALGARTPSEIAERTALDHDTVVAALKRLIRSGLVTADAGTLTLQEGAFAHAARAEAEPEPAGPEAADPATAKVLRAFVHNGRLRNIPAPGRKRHIVLEYLVATFEPGVRYSEAEVNAILRSWHEDVAALRRYLVDEQLMSREGGEYWRSGGWVDVSDPDV